MSTSESLINIARLLQANSTNSTPSGTNNNDPGASSSSFQPQQQGANSTVGLNENIDQSLQTRDEYQLFFDTWGFLLAYFVYIMAYIIISKTAFKFDNIRGLSRTIAQKNSYGFCGVRTLLSIFYIVVLVIPILIAVFWAMTLNEKGYGIQTTTAVICGVLFTTFFVIGLLQWYGTRWVELNCITVICFTLSALCVWAFALIVALSSTQFSYTSCSFTLLTINFLPACWIVYLKTLNYDINLRLLIQDMAKLLEQDEAALSNEKLDAIVKENSAHTNKSMWIKIAICAVLYIVPLVLYSLFMMDHAPVEIQLLGCVNSLFVVGVDLLIWSLSEHHYDNLEHKSLIIYKTQYQVVHMLLARAVISFKPGYWLMTQGAVYLVTQLVASYDVSQQVLESSGLRPDMMSELLQLYKKVPLLQAIVRKQLPEMRTNVNLEDQIVTGCLERFGTPFISIFFVAIYGLLCYLGMIDHEKLRLNEIGTDIDHGQPNAGVAIIVFSLIFGFFVFWYRYLQAFDRKVEIQTQIKGVTQDPENNQVNTQVKKSKRVCDVWAVLIFLCIIGVSCGMAYLHSKITDIPALFLWVTYVSIPVILGTYLVFFRMWSQNDYQCYEPVKGRFIAKTCSGRISMAFVKPTTVRDYFVAFIIILNGLSLAAYEIIVQFFIEGMAIPLYIAPVIAIGQMSVIWLITYREANFKPTTEIKLLGYGVIILILIVVYIIPFLQDFTTTQSNAGSSTSTDKLTISFMTRGLIGLAGYAMVMIYTMLHMEYLARKTNGHKLSPTFYILIILIGLGFIGIGGYIYLITSKAVGGLSIIIVLYIVLVNVFKNAKMWFDIAMSLILFAGGCAFVFWPDIGKFTQPITDITLLYGGVFMASLATVSKLASSRDLMHTVLYTPNLLPAFVYSRKDNTISIVNTPVYALLCFGAVAVWAFTSIAFVHKAGISSPLLGMNYTIYVPIVCLDTAMAVLFAWSFQKSNNAETVDWKKTQQCTLPTYLNAAKAAVTKKNAWREELEEYYIGKHERKIQKLTEGKLTTAACLEELSSWAKVRNALGRIKTPLSPFLSDCPELVSPQGDVDPELQKLDDEGQAQDCTEAKKIEVWLKLSQYDLFEQHLSEQLYAFFHNQINAKVEQQLNQQNSIIESQIKLFNKDCGAECDETIEEFSVRIQQSKGGQLMFKFAQFEGNQLIEDFKRMTGLQEVVEGPLGEVTKFIGLKEPPNGFEPFGGKLIDPILLDIKNSDELKEELLKKERERKEKEAELIAQEQERIRLEQIEEMKRQFELQKQKILDAKRKKDPNAEITQFDKDELMLETVGDKKKAEVGRGPWEDPDFNIDNCWGKDYKGKHGMERIPKVLEKWKKYKDGKVCTGLWNCSDVGQGGLGDCWFLSAISAVAHARPDLLNRLFYSNNRVDMPKNGCYTLMFYKNGHAVIISCDDKIAVSKRNAQYPSFTNFTTDENSGVAEVWPQVIEKAYAKFKGSFTAINGGYPEVALCDLTGGVGGDMGLKSDAAKEKVASGEMWAELQGHLTEGSILCASSHHGKDTDTNSLGIVQGHAYSVLDATIIDGTQLIQLRNPWGRSEWKGAWSDNSKEWTKKRLRQVMERQKSTHKHDVVEVGKDDGVFWMKFQDFCMNFSRLSYVRLLHCSPEWSMWDTEGAWSKDKGTAGGGCNFDTLVNNPQWKMQVTSKDGKPVRMTINLKQSNPKPRKLVCAEILTLNGKKVQNRKEWRENKLKNRLGSSYSELTWEGEVEQNKTYTLWTGLWDKDDESGFALSVFWKKANGAKITFTEIK